MQAARSGSTASGSRPASGGRRRRLLPALAVLAAAAVAAAPFFAGGGLREFVSIDDGVYVYENPLVLGGLTLAGIRQAFGSFYASNWIPLTLVSHMADVSLFGLDARWHHAVNVVLHAAAVALVAAALLRLAGSLWKGALAAALFGAHPLRVESVAWITERRDVLAGLFFALALLAYERYARRGGPGRMALVAVLFAVGLSAKSSLVTLPFFLLLLDFWPLGRLRPGAGAARRAAGLLLEKTPLFALSAAASLVAYLAQRAGGSVVEAGFYTLGTRAANASVAAVGYLWKTVWPARLGVFYPHPGDSLPAWQVLAATAALAAGTAWCLARWRRSPALAVGWLGFLGMLLPVSGLVQIGNQAMADRFTYLPSVGLWAGVVWAAAGGPPSGRRRTRLAGGAGLAALVAAAAASAVQVTHWRDSESLFLHTIRVTSGNAPIRNSLGNVYLRQGRVDEAILQYREAIRVNPAFAIGHSNLGHVLLGRGRAEEAATHFQVAAQADPGNARIRFNLGVALSRLGRIGEAAAQYREALRLDPGMAAARRNLAGLAGAAGPREGGGP